jgi:Rhs element Vgr protein
MANTSTSISPDAQATDQVSFKILANNSQLSAEYSIMSLEVFKSFNKISSARITIADGDLSKQDFPISSKDDSLVPGNEFEIQLGYQGKPKCVFKGIITKQSIRSNKTKTSSLTIEAKDKAIKLAIGRKNQNFTDKTDTEIIEAIAKRSGYTAGDLDIADTTGKHTEMIQYNVADWDFIVSRAEMNSLLVLTDNNKLVIRKPDSGQEPFKEVSFGKEVLEFSTQLDGHWQIKEVKTHSWNYKDQKLEESEAASTQFKENGNTKGETLADAFGVKEYNLVHPGMLRTDELKSWSNAFLLKSRMAKNSGSIKVKGLPEIKPGQVVKLNGFGKRFNGNVYVTGVRHGYEKSVWETEIIFGLTENWYYQRDDIMEKPASGLVPGISGLQIGVVIKIEGDPDKEDRVQIQLPMVDANEGIWARVSSLDAGNQRGAFFRPEIHDEVVVGFLNDDPRHPVILGMLNSSAKPAAFESKDTNDEKGFITRSKIKIILNDDKKTIHLETPKGKIIEMNDDQDKIILSDQHNNKIQMGADGITVESAKDISFKTSGGNFKIEANNIELKANVKLTAKGGATAELQSSGQTVVKGSIVSIN